MSSRFTANLPKRCKLIKSLSCYKLLQFRLNLKLLASSSIAQLSHRQAQLRENQKLKLHPISAPKTFLITYLGAEITLTPFYPSHRCQLHHPASLSTPLFKQSWNLKLSHLARISFFFPNSKPPPPSVLFFWGKKLTKVYFNLIQLPSIGTGGPKSGMPGRCWVRRRQWSSESGIIRFDVRLSSLPRGRFAIGGGEKELTKKTCVLSAVFPRWL